jgi:flagellar hook-associated protein 1
VQQKSIDVTSHNIANANTAGYSRQRATIETTTPFGMPTLNNTREPGQLGTGAQISAIERYRDIFIDYQTRAETSTKGQFDTRSALLGEVESILNEPSDTGLSTLIGKFFDSWQQLSKQPQSSNTRTIVAQQSAALADDLNHTYDQLIKLKEDVQLKTKNTVVDINSKLDQINQLNLQIIGVSVAGNRPNDLMDKRDLLLDDLSSEFNINITQKEFNGIDVSPVDTTPISPVSTDFNMVNEITTGNEKKVSYISDIKFVSTDPADTTKNIYTVTYYSNGDMSNSANKHSITLTGVDAATYKAMDETRVIWTNKAGLAVDSTVANGSLADGSSYAASKLSLFTPSNGELKGYASVQTDIDGYVDQLNNLAKTIAFTVNAVHSGMKDPLNADASLTAPPTPPSTDAMPFFVNSDVAVYDTSNTLTNLGDATAGVLFSEKDITAGNISMNKEILNDVMKIKTRTHDNQYSLESSNTVDGETDGTRAQAIAQLRDSLIRVQDMGTTIKTRNDLFTLATGNTLSNNGMTIANNTNGMKMDTYFRDTVDKLGIQSQEAQRMVKNQESLLASFEESRASVSGVSLDEEMANLIQFQHAYQANAKIISTVDELLDVVVNGLKK